MRQACFNEKQEVLVTEIPPPMCGSGSALIRTAYTLISSGTELAATSHSEQVSPTRRRVDLIRKVSASIQREGVAATIARVRQRVQPQPQLQGTGYVAAGVIIEVGEGIEDLKVGDRVACGGGSANHAEIISVPRNLIVRVPADLSLRDACFTTLGAIAMQGLRRAAVSFGETVVVIGAGLIGQLVCQLAAAAGCVVIAVDLIDQRLDLAGQLGAHYTINAQTEDAVQAVYRITGDYKPDAVLVCAATNSSKPINDAFLMCRERGRVIIVGDVGMNLNRADFYKKELDLLISRSYGPGRYDYEYEQLGIDYPAAYVRWTENRNMAEFVRLLASSKVRVGPLVSAEYDLNDAARAYARLIEDPKNTLGVLFTYQGFEEKRPETRVVTLRQVGENAPRHRVRFGVIGAGSFAHDFHIPNILKIAESELIAIANAGGVKGRQTAEQFGAVYCTTDYRELLADKNIDAVVIATRHHLHAEMCIAAAQQGKHIFVEKPLALTLRDCEKIRDAVTEADVLLTVGFNRRFAPLIVKLKEILDQSSGPKMIIYRVNAGSLPSDHWTLDSFQGGGRILGEGIHFFDLLYHLIGAEPVRIGASQARSADAEVKDQANLSISLEFAEGSTGTLVYTVIGNKDLAKERIEVFVDGKTFVLDNFDSLKSYGVKVERLSAAPADKGHLALMQNFCLAVLGRAAIGVTVNDGFRATLCALKALESARTAKFCELRMDQPELDEPHIVIANRASQ